MSEYMSNREWSTWKRRLTIAKKKSPQHVVNVCESFLKREQFVCLPDDWHRFNIALGDARLEVRREAGAGMWR
jgi:hypothetical protein